MLARGALLAHQPDLLAGQVLVAHGTNPLGRTVSSSHPFGAEAGTVSTLSAAPPRHDASGSIHLSIFRLIWIVSYRDKEVTALVWRDGVDEPSDCRPQPIDGPLAASCNSALSLEKATSS